MNSQAGTAAELERAREKFLSVESDDAVRSADEDVLRPSVLDSWRRSEILRIHPDRVDLPFVREPDRGSRLARASAPVMQRVTEDLAAQAVSVILTATDGVVIERSAAELSILKALDTVSLAPGFSLSEEVAGTNGIGTALEVGQPAFIRGGEHYVAMFTGFACAGAPIRDPATRRIIGAINLSCRANESDPLLLALATSASRHIEDRLRVMSHEGETALLETYLQQARRTSSGVLAMGGDVVLMNPYLRRMLTGNDQAALLEHASDLMTTTFSGIALAILPGGHIAKISSAARSTLPGGRTNVVFHVALSAEARARPPQGRRPTYVPGLAGRDSAWLRCCEQVQECCHEGDWVMIEGENGSGRSRMAQAVGQFVKPGRTVRIIRAEMFDSVAGFVAELAAESGDEDFAFVIADVDDIDKEMLEPIASMLAARAGRGWIAATSTSGALSSPGVHKQFLRLFTRTVTVPALRHRIDDLEELVPLLLREITRGADVRLAPDAMRQLARLPWPGNVSQLRRVLTETVARQRSGVIAADKLPPECRSVTKRKLSQIEALERDAIVRSLADHGDDKHAAALSLGMSRATIYRKIKNYGIA